jgi:hypothetical protein
MDAPAFGAARGRGDRDVDRTFDGFEEAPERRGGAVAEDGALAAGENGGHPAPVPAEASVSHGVDAAVDAVEAPELQAPRGRTLVDAHAAELLNGDHAVLPSSDSRHLNIASVDFLSHSESKSTGPSTSPPLPSLFAPVNALLGNYAALVTLPALRHLVQT